MQAVEQCSDDLKKQVCAVCARCGLVRRVLQLHMRETAVEDGEKACERIQQHTQTMRLAGKTAEVDRVSLEKNVVEWHLKESEDSEERTRRWLERALTKAIHPHPGGFRSDMVWLGSLSKYKRHWLRKLCVSRRCTGWTPMS